MSQHFGGGAAPFLIAGPCVLEADDLNLRVGEALAELGARLGLHVVFKASYDKANRSRLKGSRGPGRSPTSCKSRRSCAARPISS